LAGQNAGERFLEKCVHPENVTDFASADADVAARNISISVDLALEFDDERLAEPYDVAVALSWLDRNWIRPSHYPSEGSSANSSRFV
jgi:hypothetical protein